MANRFFSSIQNGAQRGRIYGDNTALIASWPLITINALLVGIYRGDDDWKHDDLHPSFFAHKAVSIPFQIIGTVFGAILGAFAAIIGQPLAQPKDESGYELRPVIDF